MLYDCRWLSNKANDIDSNPVTAVIVGALGLYAEFVPLLVVVSSAFFLLNLLMNHQKENLIKALRPLQHYMLNGMPALVDTLLHEHKLNQLLNMVSQEIIGRNEIDLESHDVFNFVTDIIEIYYAVIKQGIVLIQNNSERAIFL